MWIILNIEDSMESAEQFENQLVDEPFPYFVPDTYGSKIQKILHR